MTKFRPSAFSKFCFWCSGTACHLGCIFWPCIRKGRWTTERTTRAQQIAEWIFADPPGADIPTETFAPNKTADASVGGPGGGPGAATWTTIWQLLCTAKQCKPNKNIYIIKIYKEIQTTSQWQWPGIPWMLKLLSHDFVLPKAGLGMRDPSVAVAHAYSKVSRNCWHNSFSSIQEEIELRDYIGWYMLVIKCW